MCKSLKIVQTLNQPNCHCYPDHGYIDSSHLNHSNPQLQPFLLKLQAWIKLIRLWWFCWIIPQIQEFWVNFGLVLYTVTQTARFQVSPQQRACQNGLSDKARQYVENMPLFRQVFSWPPPRWHPIWCLCIIHIICSKYTLHYRNIILGKMWRKP